MNTTENQKGPFQKSKGTTNHFSRWKGAITRFRVLAELGHSQIQNRPLLMEPFSGWRIILPRAGIFQGWGGPDRPPPKSPVGRLNRSGLSASPPALGPFLWNGAPW